jgi:ABC-2 type transport system ATP-binding protein
MGETALQMEGVTKRYGAVQALRGIDLKIEAGQIYGILGPNGAGKSTLIKIISGMLRPDEGSVSIFGRELHGIRVADFIGVCPQEIVIWEGLTVLEQLLFIARMHDVPEGHARKRAAELLEAMGLTDKQHKLAVILSGGMKRRLNILLAFMHDPHIIVLDEPQAGLDPQSRILVRDYIQSLKRAKTVIITTHDMEEADKITDRLAIIDGGLILAEDTPRELKKARLIGDYIEFTLADMSLWQPSLAEQWRGRYGGFSMQGNRVQLVSLTPFETLQTVEAELRQRGIPIEDVNMRKGTLEDVFIGLTGRGLRE